MASVSLHLLILLAPVILAQRPCIQCTRDRDCQGNFGRTCTDGCCVRLAPPPPPDLSAINNALNGINIEGRPPGVRPRPDAAIINGMDNNNNNDNNQGRPADRRRPGFGGGCPVDQVCGESGQCCDRSEECRRGQCCASDDPFCGRGGGGSEVCRQFRLQPCRFGACPDGFFCRTGCCVQENIPACPRNRECASDCCDPGDFCLKPVPVPTDPVCCSPFQRCGDRCCRRGEQCVLLQRARQLVCRPTFGDSFRAQANSDGGGNFALRILDE
jgi:hypothetical protein